MQAGSAGVTGSHGASPGAWAYYSQLPGGDGAPAAESSERAPTTVLLHASMFMRTFPKISVKSQGPSHSPSLSSASSRGVRRSGPY